MLPRIGIISGRESICAQTRRSGEVSRNSDKPRVAVKMNKEIVVDDRPAACPKCGGSKVWIAIRKSRVVFDLKIGRSGITRWVVQYRYNTYRCGACRMEMTLHSRRSTKYGPNLRAYVVYLLIELRLSTQKIKEHVATVFNIVITKAMVIYTKLIMAGKYEETYQQILERNCKWSSRSCR